MLWNGNGGRVYFYQSEIPYDPPDQPSYTSAPGTNGWASYKVADSVTEPRSLGAGNLQRVPESRSGSDPGHRSSQRPNVKFHSMITVRLGNNGEISNVINNTGGATAGNPRVTPKVTSFP